MWCRRHPNTEAAKKFLGSSSDEQTAVLQAWLTDKRQVKNQRMAFESSDTLQRTFQEDHTEHTYKELVDKYGEAKLRRRLDNFDSYPDPTLAADEDPNDPENRVYVRKTASVRVERKFARRLLRRTSGSAGREEGGRELEDVVDEAVGAGIRQLLPSPKRARTGHPKAAQPLADGSARTKARGEAKAKAKAKPKAKAQGKAKPAARKKGANAVALAETAKLKRLAGLARGWIGKHTSDEELGPVAAKFAKKVDGLEQECGVDGAAPETVAAAVKALTDDLVRFGVMRQPK